MICIMLIVQPYHLDKLKKIIPSNGTSYDTKYISYYMIWLVMATKLALHNQDVNQKNNKIESYYVIMIVLYDA